MSDDGTLFRLREIGGPISRSYLLRPGTNRLGTALDNDLIFDQPSISRYHAVLVVEGAVDGAKFRIEDRASKNGTWVESRRISAAAVRPGATLRLGAVTLRLETASLRAGELAIELPDREAPPGDRGMEETPLIADTKLRLSFPEGYLPAVSESMLAVYQQIEAFATADLPVLLVGETGVGKEPLARTVHASSGRRGAFVAVNCAAVPDELLEAELFGIAKGAATGVAGRLGLFAKADRGTLFLDEVGEMPVASQAKLLRALQDGEVRPVGADAIAVDVRIVAATNARLEEKIEARAFRSDLFFRLAGVALEIPPLRRRPEDVPRLVELFLDRACEATGRMVRGVTADALAALCGYRWPGNVRELENEMLRVARFCAHRQAIDVDLLSRRIRRRAGPSGPDPDHTELDLETLERRAIRAALEQSRGNQVRAAKLLGITRFALRRRMDRFGLG